MIKKRDLAVCSISVLVTLATIAGIGGAIKPTERTVEKPVEISIDYAEPVSAAVNYDVIALQGKKNKTIEVATDHEDIKIIATILQAEAVN